MTLQSASLLGELIPADSLPTTTAARSATVDSGRSENGLSVQLVPSSSSAKLLPEWAKLEQRLGSQALSCSATWTKTWLTNYADLVPHHFVVARVNDQLVGVCLLTEGVDQFDGPFRLRTLHLGTAGEPDADSSCVEYNQILVEPRFRNAFVERLLELVDRLPGWEEFRLDGFSTEDAGPFLSARTNWNVRRVECNYFDLQLAHDAKTGALAQFGYATRKNLRKNLKALGNVTTEWAETPDEARSILADLVRLHQQRWNAAGCPGSYASRRFMQFHEQLIDTLLPTGQMALFRVTAEEYDGQQNVVLGCVQLFVDRNRILCYQGGSAPYSTKLSPGVMVDYLCIEECLTRGFLAYDFLGGETHHKRKLGTAAGELVWAVRRRPSWKHVVANSLRGIKRTGRRGMAKLRQTLSTTDRSANDSDDIDSDAS